MKIIIGRESGFCFGVKEAVDGIERILKKEGNINCLGEIVHNETVISDLEKKGVKFIESIDDVKCGEKLVIRAHGVEPRVYKEAKNKNIEVIDYTCPKVEQIHNSIENAQNENYTTILVGKKNHPETIGSRGYAKDIYVIESIEEIDDLPDLDKVFVIVQTTFNNSKYLEIEKALKEKYSNIKCVNTICQSTKNRQEECRKIAKEAEFMIIVGGKNSSNTKKLYEIACSECENCIIIQDECDKKIEESQKYDIIGVISGASTPIKTMDKVIKRINSIK